MTSSGDKYGQAIRKLKREVEEMIANGYEATVLGSGWGVTTSRRSLEKHLKDYPVTVYKHRSKWWIINNGR